MTEMGEISRRQFLIAAAAAPPALMLSGYGGAGAPAAETSKIVVTPFPEAETLFHSNPNWLGGDGVYSIDLGSQRVLWLFGDSFVDLSANPSRKTAKMPRSTVAIQTGYKATAATMQFTWNQSGSTPTSFFVHPNPPKWYWPLDGVRIGNRLVIFLAEQAPGGGLGFQGAGWAAVAIDNPDSPPSQWKPTFMKVSNPFQFSVGNAVLSDSQYLYAFASKISPSSQIHLARWPLAAVQAGDLSNPDWSIGPDNWESQSLLKTPPPTVFTNGQTEFNVIPNLPHARALLVQTMGFGASPLGYRTANDLADAWSPPTEFYRPPEMSQPGAFIYSAKLHPTMVVPGVDFVASYSTNNFTFATLVANTNLYYPRFLKCSWEA